ncbi:hypothetical protein DFJ74DRAFT_774894 [Hyaloraphidium curvatum]|nr:hypothetical protein DFJ74DRAFT_774894 [Hyaloraphidium curvatum]
MPMPHPPRPPLSPRQRRAGPAMRRALLQLLLLAGLPALAAAAASVSWPARTAISAEGGPVPHGRARWKQCSTLSLRNDEAMVPASWRGTLSLSAPAGPAPELLSLAGGTVAPMPRERNGAARYRIEPSRGAEPVEPGAAVALRFCVAYRSGWAAETDFLFSPSGADEAGVVLEQDGSAARYYVSVEPHGADGRVRHTLLRRQLGSFQADWSTGQCRCLSSGVAPAPAPAPAPPPPPPAPRSSTSATSTRPTLTTFTASTTRPASPITTTTPVFSGLRMTSDCPTGFFRVRNDNAFPVAYTFNAAGGSLGSPGINGAGTAPPGVTMGAIQLGNVSGSVTVRLFSANGTQWDVKAMKPGCPTPTPTPAP